MLPIQMLMVEDNEGDILLVTEAIEETGISIQLSVVTDGKEAMDFLNRSGIHQHATIPDLVLLDVNLPKINGYEVLRRVKEDVALRHIPVIMFTTSSSQKDINKAYKHKANLFITKPVHDGGFLEVVTSIEHFWVSENDNRE
ncbi:MAG: response regulator [Chitinophagaceae bacterium]